MDFDAEARLAAAAADGAIYVWDLNVPGAAPLRFPDHSNAAVWWRSSRRRASSSGSQDGTLTARDLAAGQVYTLGNRQGRVNRVAFSPDGRIWPRPPRIMAAGRFLPAGSRLSSGTSRNGGSRRN